MQIPTVGTSDASAATKNYLSQGNGESISHDDVWPENKDPNREAILAYYSTRSIGVKPSKSIYLAALKACGKMMDLQTGIKIHAEMLQSGDCSHLHLANKLVHMYGQCRSMIHARGCFDGMLHHDVVSWNIMIYGYVQCEESLLALELYSRMQDQGIKSDGITFIAAIKACAALTKKEECQQVDGKLVKVDCLAKGLLIYRQFTESDHLSNVKVANSLVDMFAKCGSLLDARMVFNMMSHHNVVSWNTIILGYAESGESETSLQLYADMREQGHNPDNVTFLGVLKACSNNERKDEGRYLLIGKNIHKELMGTEHECDIYVASSLVNMYANCGSMLDARKVFDRLLQHTVITWTALILGYAGSGEAELALYLYLRMQELGYISDRAVYLAAIKACGNMAAIEAGRKVQIDICNAGMGTDPVVVNCLIDFYGKCGNMYDAQNVFNSIPKKGLITWNALIAGYSRRGDARQVFDLFELMLKERMQPDAITFLCILSVCSHSGLVDEGEKYFHAMHSKHRITPITEHYTCMVDLLGKANKLDDAVVMIESMPFQPSLVVWRALLAASRKWGSVAFGKLAFDSILKLNAADYASYVMMANIYSSAGKYEDSRATIAMTNNVC